MKLPDVLRAILLGLLTVVGTGCSDGLPTEPEPATAAVVSAPVMTGNYAMEGEVTLADGGTLYVAELIFGGSGHADGRTFLVQAGVRRGGTAALLLHQAEYTVAGDTIRFAGGPARHALRREDGAMLSTTLVLDGESVAVELRRR